MQIAAELSLSCLGNNENGKSLYVLSAGEIFFTFPILSWFQFSDVELMNTEGLLNNAIITKYRGHQMFVGTVRDSNENRDELG